MTHSSYDVNTKVHHTHLPGIRNIITYVNTRSGTEAKGTDIYCPKYERVWTVWQGVQGSYEYLNMQFVETKKSK
jgi:hypothetical protein